MTELDWLSLVAIVICLILSGFFAGSETALTASSRAAMKRLADHGSRSAKVVIRLLAQNRWPWRLHATYNETITRALNVFEKVARDIPFDGLHWFIDHAETIDDRSIERIAKLGGGIAVQHRMAYQGEYFVERYGHRAAERSPPIRRMLDGRAGGRWNRCHPRRLVQSLGIVVLARYRHDRRRACNLPCRKPARP